jgi:anti-anti-sigma factor
MLPHDLNRAGQQVALGIDRMNFVVNHDAADSLVTRQPMRDGARPNGFAKIVHPAAVWNATVGGIILAPHKRAGRAQPAGEEQRLLSRRPPVSISAKLEKYGKTPLVRIKGKVADDDVQRVAERMDQAFARNTLQVILDLTGVEFMDSRGLGTVVYYHTMLQRQKRELIVLNGAPKGFLHELFETTHLNNVLRVISDLKQLD